MAINLGQPVNWQNPLNRGLVARYKVHDGYGGRGISFRNMARPSLIGTLTNGPTWSGPFGSGNNGVLNFVSGSSTYVSLGTGDFPTSGSFTLGFRWKDGAGNVSGSILSFSNTGGPTKLIDASVNGSGGIRFQLYDGTNNPFCDYSADLSGGKLHNIIVTRIAGTSINIYCDGLSVATAADSTTGTLSDGTQIWTFGLRRDSSSYVSGCADDFCGWSRALSDNEIMLWHYEMLKGSPYTLNRTKPGFITTVSAPAGLAANPLFGGGAAANPLWGYVA